MQTFGNLGRRLGNLVAAPCVWAATPTVAIFGGVVARLGQSILNNGATRSYVQQASEYVSPWVAYANEARSGIGDNAIASMSAWVSIGGEAVCQQGGVFIGHSTQLFRQGIDFAAETLGTSADVIAPAARLIAPAVLALPAIGTLACRTLFGGKISEAGQRLRTEINNGYARRAGVAAVLTATVAFASDYAPSVATGSLMNYGAFAGAMALANSANGMAGHTYMAIGSTVTASVSAVAAAVFATQHVAGGSLDSIAAGVGLAAGVLVNTLGLEVTKKLVQGTECVAEKAARGSWNVVTAPVKSACQKVENFRKRDAINAINQQAVNIGDQLTTRIATLQGDNLHEQLGYFIDAVTEVTSALETIETIQTVNKISSEPVAKYLQPKFAEIAPALQAMIASINDKIGDLVATATADDAKRAKVYGVAIEAEQLVKTANDLHTALCELVKKMPEESILQAAKALRVDDTKKNQLNQIQMVLDRFANVLDTQNQALNDKTEELAALNSDRLFLNMGSLPHAVQVWRDAEGAATLLADTTDQSFDQLMATANEHINAIVGKYVTQFTYLAGQLKAPAPAVDADAARWFLHIKFIANISAQAKFIADLLTGDTLPQRLKPDVDRSKMELAIQEAGCKAEAGIKVALAREQKNDEPGSKRAELRLCFT